MKVIYIVNDNPQYIRMCSNSISMLRNYNKNIKINLIFIGLKNDNFFKFCEEKEVEIIEKPNLDTFFFLKNKLYLSEIDEENILFLDSDTFIFGDVEELFKKYKNNFSACENKWVYDKGWNKDLLRFSPFNTGVMLFNNHFNKILKKFPEYWDKMKSDEIFKWLEKIGHIWCYEEFLTCKIISSDSDANPVYLRREDCYNIGNRTDIFKCKESIIFHSYSVQWQETYNFIKNEGKKVKRFKFVKNT